MAIEALGQRLLQSKREEARLAMTCEVPHSKMSQNTTHQGGLQKCLQRSDMTMLDKKTFNQLRDELMKKMISEPGKVRVILNNKLVHSDKISAPDQSSAN